jgi:uncharacterized heparinase superfamily protein
VNELALYFNTLRHLRPVQVAGRLRMRLFTPRPDLRAPPPVRRPTASYRDPIAPEASLIGPDTFRFLAVQGRCAVAADWQSKGVEKLWLYNLHYFDDLNALAASARHDWHAALLERWVAENPPGFGVGWEPYPLSRRIVNWVKRTAAGDPLPEVCQQSLAVQARWLRRRLEYHLLGNHLLVNAKALVHAGLHFEGPEADAWYEHGLDLFRRQLREQLLSDGGHFELSPMYHAAVLEDVLDLVNLLDAHGRATPPEWRDEIHAMWRWLKIMSHPDGEIGFFNDAALGSAPNAAALGAYAARLGWCLPEVVEAPITALEASGYVRLAIGQARVLCDCAPIGPDFLPAHSHADTLSFELSLGARRVLVNSGTSRYGGSEQRQLERGTAAHNTVVVDARDSSEVWGGFRVARRARARLLQVDSGPPAIVEASHDGYRRLAGRQEHLRRWVLERGYLEITDQVSPPTRSAVAYFHLHPDIIVEMPGTPEAGGVGVILGVPGRGPVRVTFSGAASIQLARGAWHPHFGIAVPNSCLQVRLAGAILRTQLTWAEEQ